MRDQREPVIAEKGADILRGQWLPRAEAA